MTPIPSPFGGDDDAFDEVDAFVPEHLPAPGPFLEDHDVLAGDAHVAAHATARDVFEERGVYDATFGYNLATLNRDQRHPNAGLRYATDADDPSVLRVEFTPTTAFCPQAESLSVGTFRAWNGEAERHDYDLVRVRVGPLHHRSDQTNDRLASLEAEFEEAGTMEGRPVAAAGDESRTEGEGPDEPAEQVDEATDEPAERAGDSASEPTDSSHDAAPF